MDGGGASGLEVKPGSGGRRTQAERTALSDRRMFEAAVRLIIDRGTARTTLKDVGELAGYSRGLVNQRFGSKDGFMLELVALFNAIWDRQLRSFVSDKTGVSAIIAADRALRDFLQREPDHMRAMYLVWYDSLGYDSEIRRKLAGNHDRYRKDVARWVREGIRDGEIARSVNPAQFSIQYCAIVFGIIYQWLVNPEAFRLETVFRHLETTLKYLLGAREVD